MIQNKRKKNRKQFRLILNLKIIKQQQQNIMWLDGY